MSTDVRESLVLQAGSCRNLGSSQYAGLLVHMVDDFDRDGPISRLLAGRSSRPVHDALPLRLLGAVHRIALRGEAPALASRFPSCGGDGAPVPFADFVSTVLDNRSEIEIALGEQVQTNEPRRSIAMVAVARWLHGIGVDEFDLLEIGSSAGLNQNFDRLGHEPPGSSPAARCITRCGCDPFPLDPGDDDDALRLMSFVWPDQTERMERLRTAIGVARHWPPRVTQESADLFLRRELSGTPSRPRIVFHSIVWQYLAPDVRDGVRHALRSSARLNGSPVYWARMEPAGPTADVRVTVFGGGEPEETVLADVGYHGQDFVWRVQTD